MLATPFLIGMHMSNEIDKLRESFVSPVTNKLITSRFAKTYIEKNSLHYLIDYVNVTLRNDSFSLSDKISLLVFNGGDSCRICDSSIDVLSKSVKYTCSGCIKIGASQKYKSSMIAKYGVDNPTKSDAVKTKIKNTNIKKYGKENVSQVGAFRHKYKNTMNDRYGVDYPMQNDDIKTKMISTNNDRYGVDYSIKNEEVLSKSKKTNNERYGVDYPLQSVAIRDKAVDTMLQMHDVDNYKKSDAFRQSIESVEGRLNSYQLDLYKNPSKMYELYCDNNMTQQELADMMCVDPSVISWYFTNNNLKTIHRNFSYAQKMLSTYISDTFGVDVIDNDRITLATKEIDIWIPSEKLGIEYHGIYWHSGIKNKTSHKDKFISAENADISLLQFFDTEVANKDKIVKSIISTKLGKNVTVYARKCKLSEISTDEYRNFCDNNHLQGYAHASVKIGLYYDNKLISVMSFGKSRYNSKYEYEMIRYCSEIGISVVGGPSKMFKYFINTYSPKSIISYADARISRGDLYRKLGFDYLHHTSPNYFYTKDRKTLESRVKYQKHKLSSILPIYDDEMTEIENMENNGYLVIFDAGNLVFGYETPNMLL